MRKRVKREFSLVAPRYIHQSDYTKRRRARHSHPEGPLPPKGIVKPVVRESREPEELDGQEIDTYIHPARQHRL